MEAMCLLKEWNLIEGETVAIDSFKIRGSNSLKNNFNEKKLKQQLAYIDTQISEYEAQLDAADKMEEKKAIVEKIEERKEKQEKYARIKAEREQSMYYLSRCILVIGAEKPISVLKEHCFHCFLRDFRLVLSHFRQFMEKSKSLNILSIQKFYGLYGALLNSYGLSLVGKRVFTHRTPAWVNTRKGNRFFKY
jgi:hypothetical protein